MKAVTQEQPERGDAYGKARAEIPCPPREPLSLNLHMVSDPEAHGLQTPSF